jgi:hypothetical protein
MASNYKSSSNYASTALNKKYLEVYKPPLTRDTLSDETRTIEIPNKYDRRPDLLAHDLYGNNRVWWLFAHYNREVLKDPLNDFRAGLHIVVPKKFRIPGTR